MSYLSLIHRPRPSPQPQFVDMQLLWWMTRLPRCVKIPGGSFNTSLMTQFLQESKLERRRVPFYSAQWEREGKQTEGEGEEVGEEEHKRLLSVISLPLKSSQGRRATHFPSLQIQAAHFTKHLSVTRSHILFKYNTYCCLGLSLCLSGFLCLQSSFNTTYYWINDKNPVRSSFKFSNWNLQTWTGSAGIRDLHVEKPQINRPNAMPQQRTSPMRVCLTPVTTHSAARP